MNKIIFFIYFLFLFGNSAINANSLIEKLSSNTSKIEISSNSRFVVLDGKSVYDVLKRTFIFSHVEDYQKKYYEIPNYAGFSPNKDYLYFIEGQSISFINCMNGKLIYESNFHHPFGSLKIKFLNNNLVLLLKYNNVYSQNSNNNISIVNLSCDFIDDAKKYYTKCHYEISNVDTFYYVNDNDIFYENNEHQLYAYSIEKDSIIEKKITNPPDYYFGRLHFKFSQIFFKRNHLFVSYKMKNTDDYAFYFMNLKNKAWKKIKISQKQIYLSDFEEDRLNSSDLKFKVDEKPFVLDLETDRLLDEKEVKKEFEVITFSNDSKWAKVRTKKDSINKIISVKLEDKNNQDIILKSGTSKNYKSFFAENSESFFEIFQNDEKNGLALFTLNIIPLSYNLKSHSIFDSTSQYSFRNNSPPAVVFDEMNKRIFVLNLDVFYVFDFKWQEISRSKFPNFNFFSTVSGSNLLTFTSKENELFFYEKTNLEKLFSSEKPFVYLENSTETSNWQKGKLVKSPSNENIKYISVQLCTKFNSILIQYQVGRSYEFRYYYINLNNGKYSYSPVLPLTSNQAKIRSTNNDFIIYDDNNIICINGKDGKLKYNVTRSTFSYDKECFSKNCLKTSVNTYQYKSNFILGYLEYDVTSNLILINFKLDSGNSELFLLNPSDTSIIFQYSVKNLTFLGKELTEIKEISADTLSEILILRIEEGSVAYDLKQQCNLFEDKYLESDPYLPYGDVANFKSYFALNGIIYKRYYKNFDYNVYPFDKNGNKKILSDETWRLYKAKIEDYERIIGINKVVNSETKVTFEIKNELNAIQIRTAFTKSYDDYLLLSISNNIYYKIKSNKTSSYLTNKGFDFLFINKTKLNPIEEIANESQRNNPFEIIEMLSSAKDGAFDFISKMTNYRNVYMEGDNRFSQNFPSNYASDLGRFPFEYGGFETFYEDDHFLLNFNFKTIINETSYIEVYNNLGFIGRLDIQVYEKTKSISIPLITGDNFIEIHYFKEGKIIHDWFFVSKIKSVAKAKTVFIGFASNYKNKDTSLDQLSYAVDDCKSALSFLPNGVEQIDSFIFADTSCNKNNLLACENLLKNLNAEDIVILYLSGHGRLSAKNYEFEFLFDNFNSEINDSNSFISYLEIIELLKECKPLRKILFIDACQSGLIDLKGQKNASFDEILWEETVQFFESMSKIDNIDVICSSFGHEYSYDNYDNFGLLGYTISQACSGLADLNKDGNISKSELRSFSKRNNPISVYNSGFRINQTINLRQINFLTDWNLFKVITKK